MDYAKTQQHAIESQYALTYGKSCRIDSRMKTTIDIDEKKLNGIMRMAGIRSRKAAVDYALSCTDRIERLRKLFENPLPDEEYANSLDPSYDVMVVRERDKPEHKYHVAG
jgi:Arc/MetJ family transcription regulator